MPTITTQSIGIIAGPMVNASHAAQANRAAESAARAGRQRSQDKIRAAESATAVQPNKKRAVQDEARIEGVFDQQSGDDQGDQQAEVPDRPHQSLNRIA